MARLKKTRTNESMNRQAFGYRMRNIRNALELSQFQMAKRLQMDRSYLSDLERGIKDIRLTKLQKIARRLGISASELLKNL